MMRHRWILIPWVALSAAGVAGVFAALWMDPAMDTAIPGDREPIGCPTRADRQTECDGPKGAPNGPLGQLQLGPRARESDRDIWAVDLMPDGRLLVTWRDTRPTIVTMAGQAFVHWGVWQDEFSAVDGRITMTARRPGRIREDRTRNWPVWDFQRDENGG